MMVDSLKDVVLPNEKSVCVFVSRKEYLTNLSLNENGVSKSGVWKLAKTKMVNMKKVIVYYRHNGMNEIIVGHYQDISKSNIKGFEDRYFLHFKVLNRFQTVKNWKDFCNTGSNPVKYYP